MNTIELPKERTILFTKQVDQESISKLTEKIIEINEHDRYLEKLYELHCLTYIPKPIKILIDSYGGQVYQILGCVGVIESSKTRIHTIATGAAMSCAFILLISGHFRSCLQHATPMYHQISSNGGGKIQDLEEDLNETKRLQKWLEQFTLRKTLITKEKLEEIKKKKFDWFFTAMEAVKYGVVDEILKEI